LRVRLNGKAGDLGEARSGKGRRGSWAGGARRKKGKEEIGADRWGRAVREREGNGARLRKGAGSWAARVGPIAGWREEQAG
jgi:hypothetical protein